MNVRRCCCIVPLLFAIAWTPFVRANDVLHYLPEDSLGFVVVRDLQVFDAKAQKFVELFELPIPAPLTFVQFATGLSDGLDLEGDLLLAVLPGTTQDPTPQPMVLLPIEDYEKFSASVNGDESGEVCRVMVAGEEVLIAKQGPYALLMNVEHRETLEVMVTLEAEEVAVLEPLAEWEATNDVTLALMPAGLEMLLELGQQGIEAQRQQFADRLEDPQFEEIAKQMEKNATISKWFLNMFGEQFVMGAVGLAIDDESNLRLAKRVLVNKDGVLGKTKQIEIGQKSPLTGFAEQSYVLAGGGPFPKSWGDALAAITRKFMEAIPEAHGLEKLEDSKWSELEETYRSMMKGLNYSAMIMLPGEEGDPLFSNFYGIAKVDDAVAYLDAYAKAMESWNEIMLQTTSDIHLNYEITQTTVGDAKACEIVVDVAAAAGGREAPMFNWMLEAMFGEDGKLHQMLVAANKETLVYGMAEQEKLSSVIDNALKGEASLSNTSEVQATMKLMSANAPWKIMISPQGSVQWATRVVNEFLVHLQGNTVEIPEFPPCPPVGISMNLVDSKMEFDMVWSAETLKALAAYIKTCQAL